MTGANPSRYGLHNPTQLSYRPPAGFEAGAGSSSSTIALLPVRCSPRFFSLWTELYCRWDGDHVLCAEMAAGHAVLAVEKQARLGVSRSSRGGPVQRIKIRPLPRGDTELEDSAAARQPVIFGFEARSAIT